MGEYYLEKAVVWLKERRDGRCCRTVSIVYVVVVVVEVKVETDKQTDIHTHIMGLAGKGGC